MPAKYIDNAYVANIYSTAVRDQLFNDAGSTNTSAMSALQVMASTFVRGYLQKAGYTIGLTTSNELVKLATLGAFMTLAQSRPHNALPLPENWGDHPARVTYADLANGTLIVDLPQDALSAPGGFEATDSSTSVDDTAVKIFSRDNMDGF